MQTGAAGVWDKLQTTSTNIQQTLTGVWDGLKQQGSAIGNAIQERWESMKMNAHTLWAIVDQGWFGIVGRAEDLWSRARTTDAEGWAAISTEADQLSTAKIQLKARQSGMAETSDPLAIQQQLGDGQPLPGSTRSGMERAFGTTMAGVQIHTDSTAAQLAQQFDA